MKYLLPILLSLSVLCTSTFGADYVKITDLKNRSIFVRIVEINPSSIDVELKDGRSFIVELENLSPDSLEFIKAYKVPEREITDNPVDSIVTIECRTTGVNGTGFFAYDKNRTYLYTNQHVISDPSNLEILDSQGNAVKTGRLEVSKSKDVARFRVQRSNALELCDSVKPSEYVTVMGNSEGAGVITSSKSRIMGIGPDEIEVESDFVRGNSGGPVINEAKQVVGIATYIKNPVDKPDWAKKDTRYEKPRRFTIRPTRVKDWMLANKIDFYKDHIQIEGLWYLYLQCEWAYQMLNEGKGFISTLPSSWNKDIKQILKNHNKRQLRPDAKETVRYETINNVRYRITDSISLSDKKEASKRANLRTLHRFIEDEFSEVFFHRLNNSVLRFDYFKNNQYNGSKLLEADTELLLFNIQKEIQLSSSGSE